MRDKLRDIINNIKIDRIFFRRKHETGLTRKLDIARRTDEINLNKYLDNEVVFKVDYERLGLDEKGKDVYTPYNDLTIYY